MVRMVIPGNQSICSTTWSNPGWAQHPCEGRWTARWLMLINYPWAASGVPVTHGMTSGGHLVLHSSFQHSQIPGPRKRKGLLLRRVGPVTVD